MVSLQSQFDVSSFVAAHYALGRDFLLKTAKDLYNRVNVLEFLDQPRVGRYGESRTLEVHRPDSTVFQSLHSNSVERYSD